MGRTYERAGPGTGRDGLGEGGGRGRDRGRMHGLEVQRVLPRAELDEPLRETTNTAEGDPEGQVPSDLTMAPRTDVSGFGLVRSVRGVS